MMIGKTIAHYRVLEPLGAGGMGEVFRARDLHLDRDVAVKVLLRGSLADPTDRERFRGDALEAAHRLGFLHRDLKPGNVVLTAAGTPKILDFGLAGLLHASQTMTDLTQAGAVFGSLPYMAPEQLRGESGDSRTDVYAFGAMLYQMATGRLPFEKDRPEALMFEILHGTTRPIRSLRPEVSPELDRLVDSCLSKNPDSRPPSAGVVSQALRGIGEPARRGAPAPAQDVIRSLAVLPLQNVSRDPAQEYFADGMTEALITELARVKALRVISRTSAMKDKGVQKALPEIARELNVDAILEGSALLVGKRVRV